MNGRIYDPELGRMLSPDPFVQVPENSQNFNRYSYVLNNPVNLTDPSGFSWVSKVFDKIGNWFSENWRTVVAIVVVVVLAFVLTPVAGVGWNALGQVGISSGWAQGAIVGTAAGASNTAINGGNSSDILRAAVVGGIQGGITGGLLNGWESTGWSWKTLRHVVGHGVVGGSANIAMGGKFQDGFLSAAASAAAADFGMLGDAKATGPGAIASRTIRAGIVGGTASALGGGKFANGAWTASFQHLLNAELANAERAKRLRYAEDFLSVALRYEGVNEDGSLEDQKLVIGFHQSTSLSKSDQTTSTPWCSSFVNYVIELTGNIGTNSAGSQSWSSWGRNAGGAALGAVVVFTDYNKNWVATGRGHVGFVAGLTGSGEVVVFGGNQSDRAKYSTYSQFSRRYSEGSWVGYRKITAYRVPNISNRALIVPPILGFGASNNNETTR